LKAGKFAEAEPLARECLRLRELQIPDDWLTFNALSLLGESLLGQKKYAEAKEFLLTGYQGLKQREDKIPVTIAKIRLEQAVQRLVNFYEETAQPALAAEWRNKLVGAQQNQN
jgi:TolA-binding protein